MKRIDSQSRLTEYDEAKTKGTISNCIGSSCACWDFCSYQGRTKPAYCTSDLSTGFYRGQNELTCEGTTYRDPSRRSNVFKKKHKKH